MERARQNSIGEKPTTTKKEQMVLPSQGVFSEETIASVSEYGSILGRIYKRLISEGYIIKDGKIFKPVTAEQYENS